MKTLPCTRDTRRTGSPPVDWVDEVDRVDWVDTPRPAPRTASEQFDLSLDNGSVLGSNSP